MNMNMNAYSDRANEVFLAQPSRQFENLDVFAIINSMRKWWWAILISVVLFALVAIIYLYNSTPIYVSSNLIEVRQEERNIINVNEVENVVVDQEFLITQIELLRSKSLVEQTVRELDLINNPYYRGDDLDAWNALSRDAKMRAAIARASDDLSVIRVARSRLIKVAFEHPDPVIAANFVNTLTENFIQAGLSRKFNATEFAQVFIEGRLDAVRQSLEDSERELLEYADENGIIGSLSSDDQNVASLELSTIESLFSELTLASLKRAEAESRYNMSKEDFFESEVLDSPVLVRLESDKVALEAEYIENLSVYKPDYPLMIEMKERIDLFDQEIANQTDRIINSERTRIQSEYELALSIEQELQNRLDELKEKVAEDGRKSVTYNILKRQVETERTQFEALLQRLQELSISEDIGSNLVEVVDDAVAPTDPARPNRRLILAVALLFGGVLGVGLALILDHVYDYVASVEDIVPTFKRPIIGIIPKVEEKEDIFTEILRARSSVSEGYASLRTNVVNKTASKTPLVISVTSTKPAEGKSVTTLGLALRLAGTGGSVLLIDGDMRLPTFKDDEKTAGLSGLLQNNMSLMSQTVETNFSGLSIIHSGSIVPNPSELLSKARFQDIIAEAKENFDYIVIDSPPVLQIADALVIGANADVTVFVVDMKKSVVSEIKSALNRMDEAGARILGIVVTKYDVRKSSTYYQYNYGDVDPKTKKKHRRANKKKFDLV
jgi:capsular exopolysaccharide synthesis family protein